MKEIPKIDSCKFLSKISIGGTCWKWLSTKVKGYGVIKQNKKMYYAHRISFEMFNGSLNKKLVIDHICKNRDCVNPDHLRQVSRAINSTENSCSPCALNKLKTHCKNGHQLSDENIYKAKSLIGQRIC